nr:hypothetical protein [Lachnospiraceae bacterium]
NGFTDEERAKLLGHTPETNKRFYSFPTRDYLERARSRLDGPSEEVSLFTPSGLTSNLIIFEKEKSQRSAKSKAFPQINSKSR